MTNEPNPGDPIATIKIHGRSDHELRGPVTIGRDPRTDDGATVVVDGDPLVSKSHLCVDIDQGELVVTDLGSSNGTYLHHPAGEVVVPSDRWIPIPAGVEIEFGDQRMTIERFVSGGPVDPDITPVSSHRVESDEGTATPNDARAAPATAPPSVEEPGHTVVLPPGGPAPAAPTPAPHYGQPQPQHGQQLQPQPQPQHGQPLQFGQPPPPTNGPVFVDPAVTGSSNSGAGKKILLGVGALIVAGLVLGGLAVVLGGDDTDSMPLSFPRAPEDVEEQWSTEVDGASGFAGIGENSVYVFSVVDDVVVITGLDREDGDDLWETAIDRAEFARFVGEFGDVAVVEACVEDTPNDCAVVGLDRADGDEIWREQLGDITALEVEANLLFLADDGIASLDPENGERLERLNGDVLGGINGLFIDEGGEIATYDVGLRPLWGPYEIDDDATAFSFDGERLVVATGDEIEFVDGDGETSSGPTLDGDVTDIIAVDASTIVAEIDDEVIAYDIGGDGAVQIWSEQGVVEESLATDDGAVVIVDTQDEELLVIDLESGDERFDLDTDSQRLQYFDNAWVVMDDETVTALDWEDGDEIWSDDFDGSVFIDEVLVTVEADEDVVLYS